MDVSSPQRWRYTPPPNPQAFHQSSSFAGPLVKPFRVRLLSSPNGLPSDRSQPSFEHLPPTISAHSGPTPYFKLSPTLLESCRYRCPNGCLTPLGIRSSTQLRTPFNFTRLCKYIKTSTPIWFDSLLKFSCLHRLSLYSVYSCTRLSEGVNLRPTDIMNSCIHYVAELEVDWSFKLQERFLQ